MLREQIIISINNFEKVDIFPDTRMIFITVKEYDQAHITELMQDAFQKLAAMPEPVKVEAPQEECKTYEQMFEELEASKDGQRIAKRLDKARKLGKLSLKSNDADYFMSKHKNNLINGCVDIYCYGYLAGYEKAKREAKQK